MLESDFVVGWQNIAKKDYVGDSHGYTCEQPAVGTTNGAGPRNTQIFVLAPGAVVVHALPGFWHPEDLAVELEFSKAMYQLWMDKKRKKADKQRLASMMQLAAPRTHSKAMFERSRWQGFDRSNELQRQNAGMERDTFLLDENGKPTVAMKPLNVLVHERMAKRPFLTYWRFDVAEFADYGRDYYDNNVRIDRTGVRFGTGGYMASQKRQAERRQKRAERKARKQRRRQEPAEPGA